MSMGTDYHLLSSYAGLLSLAVMIIYSGSYQSLPVRQILTSTLWGWRNLTDSPPRTFLLESMSSLLA